MPDTDSASRDIFVSLLCLPIALSMLFILVLIVMPDCADLAVASGGTARCEMGSGAYLSGTAFAAAGLYAGYKMGRMLFPARFG